MRTTFLIIITLSLYACGSINPKDFVVPMTQTSPTPSPTLSPTSGGMTTDTTPTDNTIISDAPVSSTQIRYTSRMVLSYITQIYSAVVIGDDFYFTAQTDDGDSALGVFERSNDSFNLTKFSEIKGMGFVLPNTPLYLIAHPTQLEVGSIQTQMIYQIEPSTYTIDGATATECAPQNNYPGVFVVNGMLARVFEDTLIGCSIDGDAALFTQTIIDPLTKTTPKWLRPNDDSNYTSDGRNIYQYDTYTKTLVKTDAHLNLLARYSTAGYATAYRGSVVVPDGNVFWFFGCSLGECTVTKGEIN